MNTRNIERKRIEQISPTISTGDQIQGNELFMVSARDTNSANGYSTKKMGIQALKDYVLSGISGGSPNNVNCGNPIFFDSQESDNYVWNPVYEENSTEFTKIVTHDCVAIPLMIDRNFYTTNNVADADHTIPYWRLYEEVRIDDLLINPVTLALANNNYGNTGFYLKKGQKLNVKLTQFAINKMDSGGGNFRTRLSYQFLPITNGGTFVDTDKMKALMRDYPEQYVDSDGNWKYNNATYQDGVPFSFPFSAHVAYYNAPTDYVDPMQAGENREQHKYAPKIDGKYVQNIWWTQQTEGRIDINLKANQTLEIYSNYPGTSIYFNIRSFACVPIMDNPSISFGSDETLTIRELVNRGYSHNWNSNAGSANIGLAFTGQSDSYPNLPRFDAIEILNPQDSAHGDGLFTVNGLIVLSPNTSGYYYGNKWYTKTEDGVLVYNAYITYEQAQNALLDRMVRVYYL